MTEDKEFKPPVGDVEWLVTPNAQHGFYDTEVGPHISEEVAIKRAQGVVVKAHTAFFARQQGAIKLALAPEHVEVKPWEVKIRIVEVEGTPRRFKRRSTKSSSTPKQRKRSSSQESGRTSSGTSSEKPRQTRTSKKRSSSTRVTPSKATKRGRKK